MKIKNFNKEYFDFLFPQRTRLKTEYGLNYDSTQTNIDNALTNMMLKDYDMIKDFLPEKINSVLDTEVP